MLTLTDVARGKLEEVIAQQTQHGAKVFGLRLMAQAGCCSGPRFGMALAEHAEEGDWVGEFGGVKVLVDAESAPLVEGAHIDYVESLERSGFMIQASESAPKGGGSCGCGSGGHAHAHDESGSGGGCGCGGH